MTVKRLVFLQLVLLAGLGSAYFVPSHGKLQPIGVIMELPDSIGQWYGTPQKITKAELEQLAADTSFARSLYTDAFGDQIVTSIVLAGEDPDNSIHRPERCLPAQGWTILDSRTIAINNPALPGGKLEVTRLRDEQKIQDNRGETHAIYNLNYYWFVGYNHVTPSHIDRTVIDIRDRITKGYNQRWAYITVSSTVTEGLTKFGRSEAETDQMLQAFIRELFPRIVRPSVLTGTATEQLSSPQP
ncbi:MAG TPA: EpsI family protein [Chthoniobacterales bacterium]|nr:EpsI family protein [Chthoniobacterales bacterium]